ncbi:NAD-dependent methanol dehydrogenase [Enhygromyxa salina]|uniref:NAD-dependent methanol dehydrogenase n=1 Tax=Enhygromyxa salina TaxID=215803 RepID=A0A2S9YGD2_9BACT|nr:iron-containing alcohol dehydrogenase [Enhygromyxa salina]PRQ04158.1 NAD-dependent methanol dehydrogenase [Enhygromyxa salina]
MSTNDPVGNFNYPTPYRIGRGRIRELPDACRALGIKRPLLVTDPGIVALPWFAEIQRNLTRPADLAAKIFSKVQPNPTGDDVRAGVMAYKMHLADGVVMVGGGSALDVGKCIALMVGNEGTVFDYEDVGDNWTRIDASKIPAKIAIPTTAGTGSEVGRASVIVDSEHRKKIIFHPRMLPELVIADPALTIGLPAKLTAATGMDALAHCFEAFCAPGYHPMADGIALEGMRLIKDNLLTVFEDGKDVVARTHMMMAATMGATAFQKGLGLVHALSHPLGGATNVHHGTANAIFLPYVMMFNREAIETKMDTLARVLEIPVASTGFDAVLGWMIELRRRLELPHTLEGVDGFSESMAEYLAPLAVADPSMGGNPIPADERDCERVFIKALEGDLSP